MVGWIAPGHSPRYCCSCARGQDTRHMQQAAKRGEGHVCSGNSRALLAHCATLPIRGCLPAAKPMNANESPPKPKPTPSRPLHAIWEYLSSYDHITYTHGDGAVGFSFSHVFSPFVVHQRKKNVTPPRLCMTLSPQTKPACFRH
jgi:hypothetical protein